jgi:hypothetical protein
MSNHSSLRRRCGTSLTTVSSSMKFQLSSKRNRGGGTVLDEVVRNHYSAVPEFHRPLD